MSDRFAVLSGGQVSPDGRHLLILPNDVTELVDPGVTDDELTRHDLDSIVRVPKAAVYRAAFLDGPRAGQETWIAANKAGERVQSYLPPRPGGPIATYEVIKVSEDDRPAELHLIEVNSKPVA